MARIGKRRNVGLPCCVQVRNELQEPNDLPREARSVGERELEWQWSSSRSEWNELRKFRHFVTSNRGCRRASLNWRERGLLGANFPLTKLFQDFHTFLDGKIKQKGFAMYSFSNETIITTPPHSRRPRHFSGPNPNPKELAQASRIYQDSLPNH